MFTEALFTVARTRKQPKCPSTEECIKKMWYIYTMEYYSAIKKEQNNAICSMMDLEIVILSEVSQTQKNKYHTISLLHGILKKGYKCTYLQNRSRVTDEEDQLLVTRG